MVTTALAIVGIVRFSSPASSASISGATPKLNVYQGVMSIINGKKSVYNALEIGNGGRDIAGTENIYFQPGQTGEGSAFVGRPPKCSIDGLSCGKDSDCSQTPSPQTCINRNIQDLSLTGDLIIRGQLCFNGYQDCFSSWPAMTSSLWMLTGTTLSPITQSGIRVGESTGNCKIGGFSCYIDSDCTLDPKVCLPGTLGISGKDAVSVTATTSSPTINVTKDSVFGDLREGAVPPVRTGNVVVAGSVYTISGTRLIDPADGSIYLVWDRSAPNDTQDGSGIDADTFDGYANLPFTHAAPFDLEWKQYLAIGAPYIPAVIPTASTTEGIFPMLCTHIKSLSTNKVCANGPNGGYACSSNNDCPAIDTCNPATAKCRISNIYCVSDNNCPQTSNGLAVVDAGNPANNRTKCVTLCTSIQRSCTVDNIWHCSNHSTLVCVDNADCPDVATGETCNEDSGTTGGTVVPNKNPSPCTQVSCDETCRESNKCDGQGGSSCSSRGTMIRFNRGSCIGATNDCRCSLNVRNSNSLPYLDVTGSQGPSIGGEICSGSFNTSNDPHPPAS